MFDVSAAVGGEQGYIPRAKGKSTESLELPFQSEGKRY